MKTISYTVTIAFENGNLETDEDLKEVASNIATAIKREADEYGITPDDSDAYAVKITVKPQFLDETIEINLI